jgi:hypothetical protein
MLLQSVQVGGSLAISFASRVIRPVHLLLGDGESFAELAVLALREGEELVELGFDLSACRLERCYVFSTRSAWRAG